MLSEQRVDFVLSETSFRSSDERHTPFFPLNEFLQARKYRIAGFYEIEHEGGSRPAVNYCNVLYARNGLLDSS
jgi:hypothetical protein